jgi:hypothetical protein
MSVTFKVLLTVLWVVAFGGFLVFAGAVVLFLMGMDPTR